MARGRISCTTLNIILALSLLVLFPSCSGDDSSVTRRSGILVIGEISDFEDLNPMATTDAHAREVYNQLFLMLLDEQSDLLTFKPRLAESYEFSEDRKELTFHMRDDIYLTSRLLLWVVDQLDGVVPGVLDMHITSLHCFINDFKTMNEAK